MVAAADNKRGVDVMFTKGELKQPLECDGNEFLYDYYFICCTKRAGKLLTNRLTSSDLAPEILQFAGFMLFIFYFKLLGN